MKKSVFLAILVVMVINLMACGNNNEVPVVAEKRIEETTSEKEDNVSLWETAESLSEIRRLMRSAYERNSYDGTSYLLVGETKVFLITSDREGYLYDEETSEKELLYDNVDVYEKIEIEQQIITLPFCTIGVSDKYIDVYRMGQKVNTLMCSEETTELIRNGELNTYSNHNAYIMREKDQKIEVVSFSGILTGSELEMYSIECDAAKDFVYTPYIYYVKDSSLYSVNPDLLSEENSITKCDEDLIAFVDLDTIPVVFFADGSNSFDKELNLEDISKSCIIWEK